MTMTRRAQLKAIADAIWDARALSCCLGNEYRYDEGERVARSCGEKSASAGNRALNHLAALEQQAITDYLADVPLPPGWTEEVNPEGRDLVRYRDEAGYERLGADRAGVLVWSSPRDWPAIPRAVLVRAAVQCHRLREAGRA